MNVRIYHVPIIEEEGFRGVVRILFYIYCSWIVVTKDAIRDFLFIPIDRHE